ncbi:uncharacterized protein B0T23DRAFT_370444 [Neurospora hispaniola]|uniref:Secreted protein n=1 Tax=Neurospora hispaniola TaxID=588809 RepID=A0AAJ0IFW5_9PEZI|nr:hypothetical protein B0T23DRAFT_370444 [Neurospora hispaniola]
MFGSLFLFVVYTTVISNFHHDTGCHVDLQWSTNLNHIYPGARELLDTISARHRSLSTTLPTQRLLIHHVQKNSNMVNVLHHEPRNHAFAALTPNLFLGRLVRHTCVLWHACHR